MRAPPLPSLPNAPPAYNQLDQQKLRAKLMELDINNWKLDRDNNPRGGHILTSPDGSRFRLIVDNAGVIGTEPV